MRNRPQVAIYSGATALWAMAVLGAIGVAHWLDLPGRDTVLLVVGVAFVAMIGTFIPAVQLGFERWQESKGDGESDAQGKSRR